MKTPALYFELVAICLLLVLGSLMLSVGLPGWGLITVAALLAGLTTTLRLVPARIPVSNPDQPPRKR